MTTVDLTDQEIEYLFDALQNNYALLDPSQDTFTNLRSNLEGKLISKFRITYDKIMEMRKNRYHKENVFVSTPLFMGSGLYSCNRASLLHKRLAYAIMILGGAQQNGGMGTEFDEVADKEDQQEIKRTLTDILAAFGYTPEELV